MEFLIFQVPYLGNGMTIGIVAVLHVLISHGLAIGAVTLAVVCEYRGMRDNDPAWEDLSRGLLKAVIVIVTGVGATTGVGIWFTTSALSPRGIGSLIRVFFWPWFVEWMFFVTEVVLLLIYYFTWGSWTGERKRRHLYLGVGYVIVGLGSAFLISGILGFMLTPDGWPWDRGLLSAFFNPSFAPQYLLRLAIAYSLGSLFVLIYLLFTRRGQCLAPGCPEAHGDGLHGFRGCCPDSLGMVLHRGARTVQNPYHFRSAHFPPVAASGNPAGSGGCGPGDGPCLRLVCAAADGLGGQVPGHSGPHPVHRFRFRLRADAGIHPRALRHAGIPVCRKRSDRGSTHS